MNRCPITYEPTDQKYSERGLKLLDPRLHQLNDFPFTAAQQRELAIEYAQKLSIQGIQPKLSVRLSLTEQQFIIVDKRGTFIIKPPHHLYQHLPENEDLTMHLAQAVEIETPLHGLLYNKGGTLSYFIKRFDRKGHGKKLAVEDFSQLSEADRETKYESSMEQLVSIIETYCTFPFLEKIKLFRLTLFAFLVGNEDMHLKNFSIIHDENRVALSPAYDLVNSSIILNSEEELALPLAGKKRKFKKEHFFDYFAQERLGLSRDLIKDEIVRFVNAKPLWLSLIENSFLPEEHRVLYTELLEKRSQRLFS